MWYFIAATFSFISSPILVAQNMSMLGIIGTVAGFVLLLVGIVTWSRERSRSQAKG